MFLNDKTEQLIQVFADDVRSVLECVTRKCQKIYAEVKPHGTKFIMTSTDYEGGYFIDCVRFVHTSNGIKSIYQPHIHLHPQIDCH